MSDDTKDSRVGRTMHMCLSVRGALRWPKRRLAGMFRDEVTGRRATGDQARELLMDELAKGHEVIPLGDPCEGFDYVTGCPGHAPKEAT